MSFPVHFFKRPSPNLQFVTVGMFFFWFLPNVSVRISGSNARCFVGSRVQFVLGRTAVPWRVLTLERQDGGCRKVCTTL